METNIQHGRQSPMTLIEVGLKNGKLDADTMQKLMDMQFQWDERESKRAFYKALNVFQSNVPSIKKNKQAKFATKSGGAMSYNYSTLDDILEAIRPALKMSGISISFDEEFLEGDKVKVYSRATLDGIHSIETYLIGDRDDTGQKNKLQQLGSTIEYLRRYGITSILGLSTGNADDDGKSGGGSVEDELKKSYMKLYEQIEPENKAYHPDNWNKKNPTVQDWRKAIGEIQKIIQKQKKQK